MMIVLHAFWHIEVHIPVELCIILSIFKNRLVDMLYTIHTGLIFYHSSVDFRNVVCPILLIFILDLLILLVHLSEPRNDLFLIETESESLRCSTTLHQSKCIQSEHAYCCGSSWIEILSHKSLYFWYYSLNPNVMEVGIIDHILKHVSLFLTTKTVSLIVELSQFDFEIVHNRRAFSLIGINSC